jgi:hypothetical protein
MPKQFVGLAGKPILLLHVRRHDAASAADYPDADDPDGDGRG